jgi:NifU-like protein involved in Fe-S cluster formation
MINDIYNKDVLRLAATISRIDPLEAPDARAEVRSPLCGSTLQVDLKVVDGGVVDYAQNIKACALGQASASVMAQAVIGKNADEILRVRTIVEKMLKEGGPPPDGDWAGLSALVPAKDAPSRHGAILLPFDGVLKALAETGQHPRTDAACAI